MLKRLLLTAVLGGVLLTITLAAGAAPETAAAPTEAQTSTPQQADEFPLSAEDMANCDYRFELDDAPDVCFPHKSHRRLGCGKCHHQSKAKPLNTPHPEYLTSSWHSCHSCHDPETERQKVYRNCLDCHHANPNSIADETPSSKVALHENCWKCHDKGIGAQASARCPDCHIGKDG